MKDLNEDSLKEILRRWKENNTHAYKIVQMALRRGGKISVVDIAKIKTIASPGAALNVLTSGMKACNYPIFERPKDGTMYTIREQYADILAKELGK